MSIKSSSQRNSLCMQDLSWAAYRGRQQERDPWPRQKEKRFGFRRKNWRSNSSFVVSPSAIVIDLQPLLCLPSYFSEVGLDLLCLKCWSCQGWKTVDGFRVILDSLLWAPRGPKSILSFRHAQLCVCHTAMSQLITGILKPRVLKTSLLLPGVWDSSAVSLSSLPLSL